MSDFRREVVFVVRHKTVMGDVSVQTFETVTAAMAAFDKAPKGAQLCMMSTQVFQTK